jgi:hypothetical protein
MANHLKKYPFNRYPVTELHKTHYIYQCEFGRKRNKIYVGKHTSSCYDPRRDDYVGSGTHPVMKRFIRMFGKEAVKVRILETFFYKEDALKREEQIVDWEFCEREDTFNIVPGGVGGFVDSEVGNEAQKDPYRNEYGREPVGYRRDKQTMNVGLAYNKVNKEDWCDEWFFNKLKAPGQLSDFSKRQWGFSNFWYDCGQYAPYLEGEQCLSLFRLDDSKPFSVDNYYWVVNQTPGDKSNMMKRKAFYDLHGFCQIEIDLCWYTMRAFSNMQTRNKRDPERNPICFEWSKKNGKPPRRGDFSVFVLEMGLCPEGQVLRRRDKDKPYCKENCYWGELEVHKEDCIHCQKPNTLQNLARNHGDKCPEKKTPMNEAFLSLFS